MPKGRPRTARWVALEQAELHRLRDTLDRVREDLAPPSVALVDVLAYGEACATRAADQGGRGDGGGVTLEELRVLLLTARRNGRRPTLIRVGPEIAPAWVREMAPWQAYGGAAPTGQQTVFGVPFVVDPELPPRSVELEGL